MYVTRRRDRKAINDDYVQEKSEPNLRKTARTQRMMQQLLSRYPQAESDLEALLYDFRSGQRQDRQDINRLDTELDSDEAEIDRMRQDLDDLMRRRGMTEAEIQEAKKDACYNKVRSRYKVWPSAYASGALVQCRKRGADNWGTKS
jgi:chromosome segregation ATPase